MRRDSLNFLEALAAAPSPSGFEQPIQRVVRERMAPFAAEIRGDVNGNLIVALNPGGSPRVMLAGHCDQIGFMVKYINDDGFLYFSGIGGIDAGVAPGERVEVHGKKGPVPGVVGRKPIHLQNPEERKGERFEIHKLWIDLGVGNREEAEKLVAVGDPVTFGLGLQRLQGQRVVAAGLDDKAGVFVVMEALRLLAAKSPAAAVYAVSTVQEELGLRGATTAAYALDPQVAIAVDMTFATDSPGIEKAQVGEIKLGQGPVIARGPNINPVLHGLLVQTAEKKKIPWQPEAVSRPTGTDANVIQITREGVAASLVSVPSRYMHTAVEMVSLDDLEHAATLLAETVAALKPQQDFTPR